MRKSCVLLLALLGSGGCYTFQPAAIESLPPGSVVRAQLSPAGAQQVVEFTGELSSRIEGSFIRMTPDTVVLEVWRTDLRSGPAFTPGRLRLPLQKQNIVDVAEKRLSYARTGAVAAVLGFGLYQFYQLLWSDAGGSTTGNPDPGGPSIIRCC